MEIEFDVKIDAGILYNYLLHHTYRGFQGKLGAVAGVAMLIGFVNTGYVIWLLFGLVLLLYLPWTLFLRSRQQMLNTPVFKEPLHYRLTAEGVEISQGEAKEFQSWEAMHKATATKKSIILYTSRYNASIFPKRDLGDKTGAVSEMIRTRMPSGKVKLKG